MLSPNFNIGPKNFGIKPALALETTNYPSIFGLSINPDSKSLDYAAYFFNIGMYMAGGLAALVILFGGIMWLISFSRGQMEQSGKDWVKAGALGLILLMASYVIAFTINPNLIAFNQQLLKIFKVKVPAAPAQNAPNPPSSQYSEIPIGTLTENVLARQIDCFDFDVNGEPIDGDPSTPNIEPSLKNHDRLDCILRLADAIQRKAKIASDLSDKIAGLMDTCKCTQAKCQLDCDTKNGCNYVGDCQGDPGYCSGNCVNTKCKAAANSNDASCCEANVKKEIEHGPISLPQPSNCSGSSNGPATGTASLNSPLASVILAMNQVSNPAARSQNIHVLGDIIPAENINGKNGSDAKLSAADRSDVFLAVNPPAPAVVSSISITPKNGMAAPGETQSYSVSGTDQYGSPIAITPSITVDPGAGSGCGSGTSFSCTPTDEGSYTITASIPGTSIQDTAHLTVQKLTVSFGASPTSALAGSDQPTWYSAQGAGGLGSNYTLSWSGDATFTGQTGEWNGALFSDPGKKTIYVTVSDGVKTSDPIKVDVMVNTFVTATCSVSAISVDATDPPTPVTFTADPGGGRAPYTFEWKLPSGASKCTEGKTTSRTCTTSFAKEGTYTAQVTVSYSQNNYPNTAKCTVNVGNTAAAQSATIQYHGLDEFRGKYNNDQSIISAVEIKSNGIMAINKNVWKNLRLIDKMKYLKEKMKLINLDADLKNLKSAKTQINGCYDVKTYVDYLKLATTTKNTDKTISSQETYSDPISKNPISIARYCKGFEYGSAQCFQVCQKSCGPINKTTFGLLKTCLPCQYGDPLYDACMAEQKSCVQNAINGADCSSDDAGATFQDCMANCNKSCNDDCSAKYPACSDDLKNCQNQCNNDSTSLTTNEDKCYFAFSSLQKCAAVKYCTDTKNECKTKDDCNAEANETCDTISFTDFSDCAKNSSYLCKYSTDQQPGSSDCLKTTGNNSSSFSLYTNPASQKYPTCEAAADSPEFWKCPACSNCPQCPVIGSQDAGSVNPANLVPIKGGSGSLDKSLLTSTGQCNEFSYNDDPLTFYCRINWEQSAPNLGTGWTCPANNEISIGQTVDDTIIWAQKLADAMNDFIKRAESMISYMDTKIGQETGYCQCNSTCGENAYGIQEKTCGGDCVPVEIPPQTTDQGGDYNGGNGDSANPIAPEETAPPDWSDWLDYIPPAKITVAKENGSTNVITGDVLNTSPHPKIILAVDTNTSQSGSDQWTCYCILQQCKGGSCQKMINLLRGKDPDQSCPVGYSTCGIGCFYSSQQNSGCSQNCSGWQIGIKESFQKLKSIIQDDQTAQGRSENLKRLVYSRKGINNCSGNLSQLGSGTVKVLNCQRAYIETDIVDKGCYGQLAGMIMNPPQIKMDNWFCCQVVVK